MRLKGILKSWNDDRGFGFIAPIQGDQEIFVHIKAFGPRRSRPQVNEVLWFEVEVGPEGKKRARDVEVVRLSTRNEMPDEPPAQSGSAGLVAIPGFVILYVVVSILWELPLVLLAIYLGVSAATFLVYVKDKSAAQQGTWRTPESTLHLMSFAGGWPGALLAQQILRHKTAKFEFRIVFWVTVILNVIGFLILCSPLGQQLWATPP